MKPKNMKIGYAPCPDVVKPKPCAITASGCVSNEGGEGNNIRACCKIPKTFYSKK